MRKYLFSWINADSKKSNELRTRIRRTQKREKDI